MKVGVISDIHGNLVALDAVMRDMPDVDRLVCAGDVVGYNPWHADCIAAVAGVGAVESDALSDVARTKLAGEIPTVLGNHDREVAQDGGFGFNSMAAAGVDHAREQLSDAQIEWLANLPESRVECEGRVKIVHGHPDDPDRYTYPESYAPSMLGEEDVLITGHTHVQDHRVFDDGIVMNPGSVGQPRDRDPAAAYAVLDLADEAAVSEYRVEYDIDRVITAVENAGLPEQIGTRLLSGQ